MPRIVAALRHRNYRLYFFGQLFSLVGTWMQQIAMGWLAYRLTDSALVLGLVSFAGQIPILLLAPLGGLWSDRADRRALLLGTQSAALAQAVVLAALTLAEAVAAWQLVALALVLGCINAVDIPARQSYFVQLVNERADLPNAIALNSFAMNAARFLGPALAGLVVSLAGEAACFLLNAASYLTMLIALRAVRTPRAAASAGALRGDLAQGFAYAFGTPAVRLLLALVATVSFTATPYSALMPIYARDVFGGDARTLGMLMACAGGGAMLGTLSLAARHSMAGIERVIARGPLLSGLAVAAFAYSPTLWLALPALAVAGFGIITTVASANTLIQSIVPDHLRGRVMSIFTMSFLGIAPLGALAAGGLAEWLGAPATLLAGGLVTLAVGLALRRRMALLVAA